MNIAIPAPSYLFTENEISSEGYAVYEICKRLSQRGHRLYIAAPDVRISSHLPNLSISELGPKGIMPLTDPARELVKWWIFSIRSRFWLKRLLETEDIDIVHHYFPSTPGDFSLLADLHDSFIFGPEPLPTILLDPGEFVFGAKRSIARVRPIRSPYVALRNELYRRTLRRAKRILIQVPAVSEYVKRIELTAMSKVDVVPLGVDTERFRPGVEGEEDEGTILFVGGLTRIKGLDYLIAAMPAILREIPKASLLIVGEGPDRAYFEQVARSSGCSRRIEFLGFIPRSEIARIYRKCAVFCLPSLSEAFSLVILEAMASARPIVATRVGGIPAIAEGSGILVPPRQSDHLAKAIVTLLKDGELRRTLASSSRNRAISEFDWKVIVNRVEAIYNRCMNS